MASRRLAHGHADVDALDGALAIRIEERMGCGTGICYGCAVEVRVRGGRTMKLVCKDGPRFEARDVW
ncbi:MAG: hypothetical protein HY873_08360 [Chloroflexi bacterium]|nr:hypothetical protein [Chloroflexota bacterium]